MSEIEKFFLQSNTVNTISKKDISQINNYLELAEAFSRITYKSIYIIDYQTKKFEFVSDNPLFLCGLSSQEVKELGYDFYFRVVKKSDLKLLLKINELGFNFYENLPIEDRKYYNIYYDFHIVNEKNHSILISHQLTPVFLTEEGKIWKAVCVVALSANQSSGNVKITKHGSLSMWHLDLKNEKWVEDEKVKLSERELEILRLYARGFTINEIAEKIFVSIDTVKFHRRKLFQKIGVQSINEALSYTINNKLI